MFDAALVHHSAGRLAEAEQQYRAALEVDPLHSEAWHMLGVIHYQRGLLADAQGYFAKAIQLGPTAAMYGNLALMLKAQGNVDAALAASQKACDLTPDNPLAHNTLGNILLSQQRFAEAKASFLKACTLDSNLPQAWANLGIVQNILGELEGAHIALQNALRLDEKLLPALQTQAKVYLKLGQGSAAEKHFRKVLAFDGYDWHSQIGLGAALIQQKRYGEAIEALTPVVDRMPTEVDGIFYLAVAYQNTGQFDLAVSGYNKVLEIAPGHSSALNNLGNTFARQGKFLASESCYRLLIESDPQNASAHNNLGIVLKLLGKYSDAIATYREAVRLQPNYAAAHSNLAATLKDIGEHTAALQSYERALELDPGYVEALSNLLFSLTLQSSTSPAAYLEQARRFGRVISQNVKAISHASLLPAEAIQKRALRVGFVSGDLKNHPVGFFLEGVLSHLDRRRIVPFAYVTDPAEDALTSRLKSQFAAWRPLFGRPDDQAATAIFSDKIDILVDLTGHTANGRLGIFAYKAAPLQVSWLGYFASTGVAEMDYFIADEYSAPPEFDTQFTEKIWRLPETRLCFTPPSDSSVFPVSDLPVLHNGHLTFGSYQSLSKINDECIGIWAAVLKAVPHSRMRIQSTQLQDDGVRSVFLERFAAHGITADRIDLLGKVIRADYLKSHQYVDLILDTFPFPGGTTTCEALWMGVPTLTLTRASLIGRQGASLLHCAGLPEWVTESDQDYVNRAIAFASDIPALSRLRAGLRQQILSSPLCNAERFASHLADAFEGMWTDGLRISPQ